MAPDCSNRKKKNSDCYDLLPTGPLPLPESILPGLGLQKVYFGPQQIHYGRLDISSAVQPDISVRVPITKIHRVTFTLIAEVDSPIALELEPRAPRPLDKPQIES